MTTAQNHLIFRKYTFRQFDKNINNRPMGEIAHLRNQFKLKNTFTQSYDYNILLIWREKKPHHLHFWVPFTHGCFVSSLVEIGPVILEKIFLISSLYFHYFVIISPWRRCGTSFEQIGISFTQGWFEPSVVEIGQVVLEKMKMWKVYRWTDGWQVIRKTHFRF